MPDLAAGLRARVQAISSRYPLHRYGWAGAVRSGTAAQFRQGMLITPQSPADCFECFTASLSLRDELRGERYQADLHQFKIPVVGERPYYHHSMVRVDLDGRIFVAGFSPFESMMEISPLREMTQGQWDSWAEKLEGKRYDRPADDDEDAVPEDSLLLEKPDRPFFYPFAFHYASRGGVMLEIAHWVETGKGGRLALRASRLVYNPELSTLNRLSVLSFIISFPNFRWSTALTDCEIISRGETSALHAAALKSWYDFLKLAELTNTHLYR